MAASFNLELDTTAPQVELSAPSLVAEQLLVFYDINEPADIAAFFESDDGTVVQLAVHPTVMDAMVPSGTERTGVLRVTARDEVWNEATQVLPLNLQVRLDLAQPRPGSLDRGRRGAIDPGHDGAIDPGRID